MAPVVFFCYIELTEVIYISFLYSPGCLDFVTDLVILSISVSLLSTNVATLDTDPLICWHCFIIVM